MDQGGINREMKLRACALRKRWLEMVTININISTLSLWGPESGCLEYEIPRWGDPVYSTGSSLRVPGTRTEARLPEVRHVYKIIPDPIHYNF